MRHLSSLTRSTTSFVAYAVATPRRRSMGALYVSRVSYVWGATPAGRMHLPAYVWSHIMNDFKNILIALHNDEDGAGATEYIILLVLIACVVISIVKLFGSTISGKYDKANEAIARDVDFGT